MEQDKEYRSEIQGLTIAVTHMEAMVHFYEQVFLVTFQERPLFDAKLYTGPGWA